MLKIRREIINSTKSLVCSYYSSREFNDLISVDRHDLDDLFGSEICLYVEQVNQYYQEKFKNTGRSYSSSDILTQLVSYFILRCQYRNHLFLIAFFDMAVSK